MTPHLLAGPAVRKYVERAYFKGFIIGYLCCAGGVLLTLLVYY